MENVMQTTVTEDPSRQQQPARRARFISEGTVGRFGWKVLSAEIDFFFRIIVDGNVVVTSDTDYKNAPQAEKAAKAWCEDPTNALAAAAPPESVLVEDQPSPSAEETVPPVINGWKLIVGDDRGGTYKADLVDAETGEMAPEDFRGYSRRDLAGLAASTWAEQHPAPSLAADPDPVTDPVNDNVEAGDELDLDAGSGSSPAEPASVVEAAPTAVAPAPAPAPSPTRPDDHERDWSTVDEVWTLLAERDAVDDRLSLAEAAKQRAAAQAKEIRSELEELDARIRVARNNAERQRVLPLHPAPRPTFAGSEATRSQIGAEAEAVAARLGPQTWSFNGTTFEILHEVEKTTDGDRYTTWLKGHRDTTEEHGFTFDQAAEATKNAASVVFANADPGSTAASEDAGPVADGARTPSKRKPGKLKGHDQAAVIAAVEKHLTLPEAAIELGCTPQQLEKYAEKTGLQLTKHQGRRAGEELPAGPQEKAGKPRGRKKARGAT